MFLFTGIKDSTLATRTAAVKQFSIQLLSIIIFFFRFKVRKKAFLSPFRLGKIT
jgi:hypothetical protein